LAAIFSSLLHLAGADRRRQPEQFESHMGIRADSSSRDLAQAYLFRRVAICISCWAGDGA